MLKTDMKSHLLGFLVFLAVGLALTGCAPTMSVNTQNNSGGALDRNALHYITPPSAAATPQTANLYPLVVKAFQQNHIALTQNRKDATYIVTWGSHQTTTQVSSLQQMGYYNPYGGNLNANAYNYGNPAFAQSPTGPEYARIMQSVNMQNFAITVWKRPDPTSPPSQIAWDGTATIAPRDAKDPAAIINSIVARYGTNFKGNATVGAGN